MRSHISHTPLVMRFAFWSTLILLTVLSLLPAGMLPPPAFSLWDKAQHALGFAVLTALGLLVYPRRPWLLALALLIFGGAIELAQAATGWRQGDWLDLFADTVGIGLGGALIWLQGHLLNTRATGGRLTQR